jgi:hypothetical protein
MKAKLIKDNDGYWLDISDDGITKRPLTDFGQLSIKNCEAIANGYDLDELADEHCNKLYHEGNINWERYRVHFKLGFQKAIEILGDKKFSEEDVLRELNRFNTMPNSTLDTFTDDNEMVTMKWFEQSLQQTEWDVEVVMEWIPSTSLLGNPHQEVKIDSNGCLILKS